MSSPRVGNPRVGVSASCPVTVLSSCSRLLLLSHTPPASFQSSLLYHLPIVSLAFLCMPLAPTRRPSKICVQGFCVLIMCPKYCNFRFFTAATSSSCIDAVVTLRHRLPRVRMRSNADLVQLHVRVTNPSCSFVIVKFPPFHFTRSIYLVVDNYILLES